MEFNVLERLVLLKALSEVRGDLSVVDNVDGLMAALRLTDQEEKKIKMRNEGTAIHWDQTVVLEAEIDISRGALDGALHVFSSICNAQALRLEYLPIYKRLLNEKELRVIQESKKPAKLAAV